MVFGRTKDNIIIAAPITVPGTEASSQAPIAGTGVVGSSRPSTESPMETEQVAEIRDELQGETVTPTQSDPAQAREASG